MKLYGLMNHQSSDFYITISTLLFRNQVLLPCPSGILSANLNKHSCHQLPKQPSRPSGPWTRSRPPARPKRFPSPTSNGPVMGGSGITTSNYIKHHQTVTIYVWVLEFWNENSCGFSSGDAKKQMDEDSPSLSWLSPPTSHLVVPGSFWAPQEKKYSLPIVTYSAIGTIGKHNTIYSNLIHLYPPVN